MHSLYLEQRKTMKYTELYNLNKSGTVKLVRDLNTGELFVQKILQVYDLSVYEYLIRHNPDGIPRIHSYEEISDGLLVTEEYINGRTLASIIKENGPVSFDIAMDYLKQVCTILAPLHQNNPPIVHRDIKPSNILITYQGFVYLLDFNAATRYTEEKDQDTVLIGTTGYAAPEQYGFKASDPRSDVYAIGRTAEELFTGEKPLPDNYVGPIPNIIKKSLQLDPDSRYNDAADLLAALNYSNEEHTIKSPSSKFFSDENREIHKNSWLPPGFRTKQPWKMIIAGLYYFFWIIALYGALEKDPKKEWIIDIIIVISVILETLFLCNYKDIHSLLPLTRSKNLAVRILGTVFYFIAIVFLCILLYGFFTTFIWIE